MAAQAETRTTPPAAGQEPVLDGVRGLAILLVIGYHLGLINGGYLGVDLFFVLSGYLITRVLLRQSPLRSFYIRRVGRLAPALLLTLCACVIVATFNSGEATWIGIVSGLTYSSNFLLASGQNLGLTGHLWTLAVEEQFYILWPVLLLLCIRRRGTSLAALVATVAIATLILIRLGLVLAGASHDQVYFAVHYDGLMVGALLALRAPRLSRARFSPHHPHYLRLPLLLLLVLAGVLPAGEPPLADVLIIPIVALVCAAVILSLSPTDTLFSSRAMVWTGRRSYGLYLYHSVLLSLATRISEAMPVKLAATAATFALATVSLRFVEEPIRRAAREYAARLEARASTLRLGMPAGDHV